MPDCTAIVLWTGKNPILEAAHRYRVREALIRLFEDIDLGEQLKLLAQMREDYEKYEGAFIYPDTPESEGWLGPK